MAYFYPFGVLNKAVTASFAELSVTASLVNTVVISASFADSATYPGPQGLPGTSYTTPNCPDGYIECPSLSVPGYSRVCQQLGTGCFVGLMPSCPTVIPGCPTTTTTSTSTTTTTTAAPTTTTTTTLAPTTTTTTTLAPTTTTTTTLAPTTTSTTSTTTTLACVSQYFVAGPEISSTLACSNTQIPFEVWSDGVAYYTDICTTLIDPGFYKKSGVDEWVQFNGSGQLIAGPTSCNITTTTTTAACIGEGGTCLNSSPNCCSGYTCDPVDPTYGICIETPPATTSTTTTAAPTTTTTTTLAPTTTTTIAPGTFINVYSVYQSSPESNCSGAYDDQYLLVAELVNSVGTPINNTTGNSISVVVEYNEQNSCNSTNIDSTDTLIILNGQSSANMVYYTTINDDCGTPPNCNGTIIQSYTCITSVTNSYVTGSGSQLNYC